MGILLIFSIGKIIRAGLTGYGSVEMPSVGDALLGLALENFGRLDSLIINEGILEDAPFRKQSLDQLKLNIDINLIGTLNTVHPIFWHMCEKQNSSIVMVASLTGIFGQLRLTGYSVSKAARIRLMDSLSLEGSSKTGSFNEVSSYPATQMTDEHMIREAFDRLAPELDNPVIAWLFTGAVTGDTLIVGDGGVARAKMKTTATLRTSKFDNLDWKEFAALDINLEFDSPSDSYQRFYLGLSN